jgi:hypothetical protein
LSKLQGFLKLWLIADGENTSFTNSFINTRKFNFFSEVPNIFLFRASYELNHPLQQHPNRVLLQGNKKQLKRMPIAMKEYS